MGGKKKEREKRERMKEAGERNSIPLENMKPWIANKRSKVIMNNNLFTGNSKYDYKEINDEMKVEYLLDESVYLDQNSEGNIAALIQISVPERWANLYASRVEVTREEVDAAVNASNSGANQLRSMLGLNLQAVRMNK